MGFSDIVLFQLNIVNQSMQKEINSFFKEVKKEKMKYDKSAMSKARQKISPSLYEDLNSRFIREIYEDRESVKLYHGLRLFGIDGTNIELPNMGILKDKKQTEEIQNIYGRRSNTSGELGVMSKASVIYDLENNIVLDGILNSYASSERAMAVEHIRQLKKYKKAHKEKYKDLVIFDRGYPSIGLISYMNQENIDYLMRIQSNTFTEIETFKESELDDAILELEITKNRLYQITRREKYPLLRQFREKLNVGETIKVRVIKVVLETGEIEVLITSLFDVEAYPHSLFKELYFKRWGIELEYNILKNIFKVENFTGVTQIAINQDFFATLFTSNICSLIMDAIMEDEVTLYNQRKERKYLYQLNQSFSIGCMKNTLVSMLLKHSKVEKIYEMIQDEIMDNLLPIKPNRSFSRKKKFTSKFPVSKKDSL
jgi:hypothetical protein